MTGIDGATLGSIAASIVAAYSAWLAFRNSKRANDTAARKVSLEEFDAVQERYRKLLEDLQNQLDRVIRLLSEEQDVSDGLRRLVRELQATVDSLYREMSRAGISVPPMMHGGKRNDLSQLPDPGPDAGGAQRPG